jgi:hypothetical protein
MQSKVMENKFIVTESAGQTFIECPEKRMRILVLPHGDESKPDLNSFDIYASLEDESIPEVARFTEAERYPYRVTGLDLPEASQWSLELFYSAISFFCKEHFKMEAEYFAYDGSLQSFHYLPDTFFGLSEDDCTPGTWKYLNGECNADEAKEIDQNHP